MSNASDTKSRRRFRLDVLVSSCAGALAAGARWRREIRALVDNAGAYVRKRAVVTNPVLIINRWRGDEKAEHYGPADEAKRRGIGTVMLERGDDLAQLAHDAIDSGADTIGMAGGDGSLALVASVAVEHDVPFFCIPVGTRNHFPLDLGLDRGHPLTALPVLSDGEELAIDHGVIGDRFFLDNAGFGICAEAVHKDAYRDKKAATVASVVGVGAFPDLPVGANPASTELSDLRGAEEWQTTSFRIESEDEKIVAVGGEALSFELDT